MYNGGGQSAQTVVVVGGGVKRGEGDENNRITGKFSKLPVYSTHDIYTFLVGDKRIYYSHCGLAAAPRGRLYSLTRYDS